MLMIKFNKSDEFLPRGKALPIIIVHFNSCAECSQGHLLLCYILHLRLFQLQLALFV